MIFGRISDISPKMKSLNRVISILMHFYSVVLSQIEVLEAA